MGRAAFDAFPEARAVFEAADHALGMSLARTCFEGPEEALRLTATTQPAILATSAALLAALRARCPGIDARVVCAAGHSLGEYTALCAAGSLALEDAVRIVRRRGEYMQEAVPIGEGAMAAVLGASLEEVRKACALAAQGDVLAPANLNAPDQTVVAGSTAAVKRLVPIARQHGARRVLELPVSAPFHCALMRPAQDRLAGDLERLTLGDAVFPVLTNVHAAPERRAGALRQALREQVTAPVRWVEIVQALPGLGVDTVVEIGPGRVLTGLVRRIAPDLKLLNVEEPVSLAATTAALSGARPSGASA